MIILHCYSLIIQTLHIAPWENGRERRVLYLTPLIASQSNCLIFVVGSDWLLEQLNYICKDHGVSESLDN